MQSSHSGSPRIVEVLGISHKCIKCSESLYNDSTTFIVSTSTLNLYKSTFTLPYLTYVQQR